MVLTSSSIFKDHNCSRDGSLDSLNELLYMWPISSFRSTEIINRNCQLKICVSVLWCNSVNANCWWNSNEMKGFKYLLVISRAFCRINITSDFYLEFYYIDELQKYTTDVHQTKVRPKLLVRNGSLASHSRRLLCCLPKFTHTINYLIYRGQYVIVLKK